MSTWTVGTEVVHSGGKVDEPRGVLAEALEAVDTVIPVGPPPFYCEFDQSNDWLLDVFIRDMARIWDLGEVETDYKAKLEDAPPAVREYIASCEEAAKNPPKDEVVY